MSKQLTNRDQLNRLKEPYRRNLLKELSEDFLNKKSNSIDNTFQTGFSKQ